MIKNSNEITIPTGITDGSNSLDPDSNKVPFGCTPIIAHISLVPQAHGIKNQYEVGADATPATNPINPIAILKNKPFQVAANNWIGINVSDTNHETIAASKICFKGIWPVAVIIPDINIETDNIIEDSRVWNAITDIFPIQMLIGEVLCTHKER